MSPTTTQPDTAQFQALVQAQGVTRQQIALQIAAITAASARAFTGWYDHGQITDWATRLAKVTEPLLRLLGRNTDAYTARAVTGLTGDRFRPVGAVDVTSLRTGVTHAGAYARAADVYRWQQSQYDQIARLATTDLPKAQQMLGIVSPLDAAVERVQAVANTDTQLVVRAQAQQTMQVAEEKGLVTAWRRVVHPELAIHGTCGLCIAASDRVYKVSNLMPIHARCNCIPVPITERTDALGRIDPGLELNEADFRRLYGDAGGAGGKGLKRTRYQVSEHGELGPVLNDGTFRTPRRVRESTDVNTRQKTPAERRQAVERIHRELADALPSLRDLALEPPRQWDAYVQNMEHRVAELERELAA